MVSCQEYFLANVIPHVQYQNILQKMRGLPNSYEQTSLNQPQHEQQGLNQPRPLQQKQSNTQYLAILAFVLLIAGIIIFKFFTSYDAQAEKGRFYINHIMSLDLIDQWKMTQEKMMEEQANTTHNIIDKAEHQISRQQLGRQSWSLLHMATGAFPEQFDNNLREKFNTFLILFGQMYPCKLCANHFMQLLKNQGLFKGNTKKQLMLYLCQLHNKVNKRLGHPIHDCSNVVEQWNTCGCSGEPNA